MTVVILVADGARPDTLATAIDAGELPALAALRRDGGAHVVTSVFPSVTGPAYVPFLMGAHPGEAGLPGIRWWDRTGQAAYAHGNARSYVGWEALRQDGDLSAAHATLFERARSPLAALSPIGRGLAPHQRLGASLDWWPRFAWTHFRGDVDGWLRLEARLGAQFAGQVATGRHDLAFFAHPCIDKFSHQLGHDSAEVRAGLRSVDSMVDRLRADASRDGRRLDLMVVSDHGHSPVASHLDLAGFVHALGYGVMAHPWTFAGGDDVAVMVGGNAMAHLYLDLGRRARPWWPALGQQWNGLVDALLAHEATDLLLLPHGIDACEVRGRGRGAAMVRRAIVAGAPRYAYQPLDGDPLGLGSSGRENATAWLDAEEAYDATIESPYPDSLVQVVALAGAARAGEIIVSAAPGWDLRARWEPIPHRSTHGSLRREHLLVPLLTSFATIRPPRRTSDVYALASAALTRA